jgi:hypothetical protein
MTLLAQIGFIERVPWLQIMKGRERDENLEVMMVCVL